MSIEGGARAGLIAPDDTTFEYLHGRAHAPAGPAWDAAVERWRTLPTDDGATYDKTITIDADALEPMVTYGTNPGHGHPDHQPRSPPRPTRPTRASGAPSSARSSTWTSSPARRSSARRSTSSSSAAAPTAGSATCASRPACSRTATSPTACG